MDKENKGERFYIFSGFNYGFNGGAEDLQKVVYGIENAKAAAQSYIARHSCFEWSHVMNEAGEIVAKF